MKPAQSPRISSAVMIRMFIGRLMLLAP